MGYSQSDIYDAVAIDHWHLIAPTVRRLLRPWAEATGAAVDLGAGTGLSTSVVADAFDGEIVACEPEFGQRAALMTRVCASDNLARRVTIRAWDSDGLVTGLAEPVVMFTAFNMLGHLGDDERTRLWDWLGRWLTDTGVAVVGPVSPDDAEPVDSEDEVYATRQVGRLQYSGSARSEVIEDGRGVWHMTWCVTEGDTVVEERSQTFPWQSVTAADTVEGMAQAGLSGDVVDGFVVACCAQ